ncbi:MAG: hypothetical protein Q3M30_12770 [Candidatus Electrothrix sp. Rat3]|nr:hypothetical protein [Candidatus Electrothrix rattekaaiensis]
MSAPDRNHTVSDCAALRDMIRNDYSGSLVDVCCGCEGRVKGGNRRGC